MTEVERKTVVLVVDDDADHATMLELLLEAAGYTTFSATSCAEAQAVLGARAIDALVSDLTLGDGTAIDLLEGAPRRPPVAIVLTGFDSEEDVARTRAAGFRAHLVKPAPIDALCAAIDEGLRANEKLASGIVLSPLASAVPREADKQRRVR